MAKNKRKVTFDVPEIEEEEQEDAFGRRGFDKKFKHTLDSDEEDDEVEAEKYNVLEEDVEGEEDKTIDYEGNTRITPFNMNEELEEGHFDKDGTYIFHKDKDAFQDSWLDNVNWVKINELAKKEQNKADDNTDEPSEEPVDIMQCYKNLLTHMQPGETVQKAIQRFGKIARPVRNWKNKNADTGSDEGCKRIDQAKETLLLLSSVADKVLQTGDMDIYERTYEQLNHHLKNKGTNDPDDDMFAEEFDASKKTESKSSDSLQEEVRWEFKWEDKDDAPVYGPHSSQEMLSWVNEGYFSDGVFVRQCGKPDSTFYSSKRVDFELYTDT